MTGLLIGKNGENLKKLMTKTKAQIFIPKNPDITSTERTIQIKGTKEQIENVKKEIALLTSTTTSGGRAAIAAAQLKEKQQAVAAITMYLPPCCI